ncbi:MAG: 3-deoxy-8-phosphooctulonate synthase [Bacteroidota bacterium]|nr:3-deoxy-8-phosphooctulonate synthase [Bacteroidota bacterium]MDP4236684.1 3-deoxy-8-phosphooctulonate synthase [Bacteroidota bacterium]
MPTDDTIRMWNDDEVAYKPWSVEEETCIDGWYFGAITEFEDPEGCTYGDGFVQAPDGSRAGIVWDFEEGISSDRISEILPPEPSRWGVYQVWFPKPVRTIEDLKECFAQVLPAIQAKYAEVMGK